MNILVVFCALVLGILTQATSPPHILIQWTDATENTVSFIKQRDAIVTVINLLPQGSIVTLVSVGIHNDVIFDSTLQENNSWKTHLFSYIKKNATNEISFGLLFENVEKYLTRTTLNKVSTSAEIIIFVASESARLTGTTENHFNNKKAYVVISQHGNLQPDNTWRQLATDSEHIFSTTMEPEEVKELSNVFEKDLALVCDVDQYFHRLTYGCRPCRSVCSMLYPMNVQSRECRVQCHYFMKQVMKSHPTTIRPVIAQLKKSERVTIHSNSHSGQIESIPLNKFIILISISSLIIGVLILSLIAALKRQRTTADKTKHLRHQEHAPLKKIDGEECVRGHLDNQHDDLLTELDVFPKSPEELRVVLMTP